MSDNGKGDAYRPVDPAKWAEGYEAAFGAKKEQPNPQPKRCGTCKRDKKGNKQ